MSICFPAANLCFSKLAESEAVVPEICFLVGGRGDCGGKFKGRARNVAPDGTVYERACPICIILCKASFCDRGYKVVGVKVRDGNHCENFASIWIHHHGGTTSNEAHDVCNDQLDAAVDRELYLGTLTGGLVVFSCDDLVSFIAN